MHKFRKLSVKVSDELREILSDFLLGNDAFAVGEDELKDELNGKGVIVFACYDMDTDLSEVMEKYNNYISFLTDTMNSVEIGEVKIEEVDRSSWESWKNELKTVKVGRRIIVVPPWERYTPVNDEIVIEINPSRAFGTGHHETTKLCVKYIEDFVEQGGIGSMLDVGCGSGILSIAASKLGVKNITGFDTDPIAIEESIQNSDKNEVLDKISFFTGTMGKIQGEFDLIVANVTAEVNWLIRNEVKRSLSQSGSFVASGISTVRSDEVVAEFEKAGFYLKEKRVDGDWVGLCFAIDKV